jgi:hypothetical protein
MLLLDHPTFTDDLAADHLISSPLSTSTQAKVDPDEASQQTEDTGDDDGL